MCPHVSAARVQVSSRPASASVQAAAQRLSQGRASLAQSLVDFDPALAPAMQYTFGNAFVCQVSKRVQAPADLACSRESGSCHGSSLTSTLHISLFTRSLHDMQDADVAKSLAFSQEVRTRCITLQGDDFNPSGTLTGMIHQPFW